MVLRLLLCCCISLQIAESLALVSILAFLVANVLLVADTIPVGVAPVAFHLFGATDIRPDGVATTSSNGGSSIFDSVKARYLSKRQTQRRCEDYEKMTMTLRSWVSQYNIVPPN